MAPSLNSAATSAPFKPHWEPSVGWAPELRARRAQRRLVELRGRNPDLRRKDTSADPRGLTKRQRDVLELLAAGNSDAEIATALCISPKTANTHVGAIMAKLGVHNRTQAAAYAYEQTASPP
jgi:DNA-binding NarL/FixJ family response regulator